MSEKDGGPAFPRPHVVADANLSAFHAGAEGMSLRDWFAGLERMSPTDSWWEVNYQVEVGGFPSIVLDPETYMKALAEWRYQMADAMLAQRENQP